MSETEHEQTRQPENKWVTVEAAAAELGVPEYRVRRWCRQLTTRPLLQDRRRYEISRESLDAYVARLTQPTRRSA